MPESDASKSVKSLSGMRKASMLLVALGAEVSSSILQQLTPDEIERLTSEIVLVNRIEPEIRRQLFEECKRSLAERPSAGGIQYARSLLAQVVGETKANELLGRAETGGGNSLRWLRTIPPRQLVQIIGAERPQVVALVLGHLPAELAAQVLAGLSEGLQGEVALRLSIMRPTDPETVKSITDILFQRLSSTDNAVFTEVGGSKTVINILNNVDRGTEKKILQFLADADENIANEIKESMFVFEDILSLDDRSIQIILRDVPQEDMRLALKGSSDVVKDTFFRNMSQRAADTLKEDLEASGPVRLRDIEAAQGRIASIARQLDEAGEISLRDTGEEVIV